MAKNGQKTRKMRILIAKPFRIAFDTRPESVSISASVNLN